MSTGAVYDAIERLSGFFSRPTAETSKRRSSRGRRRASGADLLEPRILLSGANNIQSAQLTLRVFDVDFNCSEAPCERDATFINGNRLSSPVAFLTGANDQWSTVSYTVNPSFIKAGSNSIHIAIDTLDGDWCVEVDWGQLQITYKDGKRSTFRTDKGPDLDQYDCGEQIDFTIDVYEVKVKEAFSYDDTPIQGIGDKVYDSASPADVKPISDGIRNSFVGISWDGSFSLDTHFDLGGAPGSAGPFQVDYNWSIDGSSKTGSGRFSLSSSDTSEKLTIGMPSSIGQYDVSLEFKVRDAQGNLVGDEKIPKLKLYATLANSLHSSTKLEWLQKGTEWAAGASTDVGAVGGVLSGIYTKSGWIYEDRSPSWQSLSGLGGTATAANCYIFAYAWQGISRALGVPAGLAPTVAPTEFVFLGPIPVGTRHVPFVTKPARALDGKTGNAHAAGSAIDRWVFSSHQFGTYAGKYYDPTFGTIWSGAADDFVAAYGTNIRKVAGRTRFDTASQTFIRASDAGPWGDWVYGPKIVPIQAAAPAAPASPVLRRGTGSRGIDSNGDGLFENLAFDVAIDTTMAGTWVVSGYVESSGQFITDRGSFFSMTETRVNVDSTGVGSFPATVLFSGEDIRSAGLDGPYRGVFTVTAPDGSVSTFTFDTGAMTADSFGELPAALTDVSAAPQDTDADSISDQLNVQVTVTTRSTTGVDVETQLFSPSGTSLGLARGAVSGGSAGPHDVLLTFDGALLQAAGEAGEYRLLTTVFDAAGIPIESRETPIDLNSADFESNSGVQGNFSDAGIDTNSNTFFDDLAVSMDVAVTDPGDYSLEGTLVDSSGNLIDTVITGVSLTAGINRLTLNFDGRVIHDHATDGPYTVRYVALANTSIVGRIEDSFETAAYRWQEFEPAEVTAVEFTGNYTESTPDADANGVLDSLVITVEVMPHQTGSFEMNGRLLDAAGNEIEFAAATASLTADVPSTLSLTFSGPAIFANGGDGPFRLTDLSIYLAADPAQAAFLAEAYTTGEYQSEDFGTAAGTVSGRVWYDGNQNGTVDSGEWYINGRMIHLYDSTGTQIATAISRDEDLDGNGVIDPATEQGYYEFSGLADGVYTVREFVADGWKETYPVSAAVAEATELDAERNFRTTSNDFRGWAGLDERWLQSSQGWHYITPAGGLFRWLSGRGSSLQSEFVARLTPAHHADLELLASPPALPWHQVTIAGAGAVTGILFGNTGASTIQGRKFEDVDRDGVADPRERPLNGWEIQLIDALTGAVVHSTQTQDLDLNADGRIDPTTERGVYWFAGVIPGKYELREVPKAGWKSNTPGKEQLQQAFELDAAHEFETSNATFLNWGNRQEKWIKGQDGWYFITPDGSLSKWNRSPRTALTGDPVAQLSPYFYDSTARLTDPLNPESVVITISDEQHLTGKDFANYRSDGAHGLKVTGNPNPSLKPGNVTVRIVGKDVIVEGDKWDNQVAVFRDWQNNVVVTGLQGTTVNGQPKPLVLVTGSAILTGRLRLILNDGNDVAALQGITVLGDTRIDAGAGSDSILVSDVQFGRNLEIYSGFGAGTISISDSTIANNLIIAGSETVDNAALVNVTVSNFLSVDLGAGADRLVIQNSVIHDDARVRLGTGDDRFATIGGTRFVRQFTLEGNAGSDAWSAGTMTAGRRTVAGMESNLIPNLPALLDSILAAFAVSGLDDDVFA